jgi:hypothetical protein
MKLAEQVTVGVFVVVLAGAFGLDRLVATRQPSSIPERGGPLISTGWYCPAPSVDGVDPVMAATNLGKAAVGFRQLTVGGGGQSGVVQNNLDPLHRSSVALSKFGKPDATGITEAFGANLTADLSLVAKSKGFAASNCGDQPWDRWLFASGSTARGENHYLVVANPFDEEAVIKVRFLTADSDVVPARLKSVVIPSLSQTSIYLPDYLPENPRFGLEVTASQGRVLASRFSQVATKDGVRGLSLDLGARAPALNWAFAGGEVPSGGEESIAIINPGAREALVQIVFPTENERLGPEKLAELPIPAGRQVTVNLSDQVPRGTKHATLVSSINSVPVVAEEVTTAQADGGRGYESVFGSETKGRRWVVPVGSDSGGAASVWIVNTSRTAATVKVTLDGPQGGIDAPDLKAIKVDPGRLKIVDLGGPLAGRAATALIESTGGDVAVQSRASLAGSYADYAFIPGRVP